MTVALGGVTAVQVVAEPVLLPAPEVVKDVEVAIRPVTQPVTMPAMEHVREPVREPAQAPALLIVEGVMVTVTRHAMVAQVEDVVEGALVVVVPDAPHALAPVATLVEGAQAPAMATVMAVQVVVAPVLLPVLVVAQVAVQVAVLVHVKQGALAPKIKEVLKK